MVQNKFFFGKKWAGRWHGATVSGGTTWGVKAILIMEKYVDPENVTLCWSWGKGRGSKAGKMRKHARIKDGKLEFIGGMGKRVFTFEKSTMHEDALEGTLEWDGGMAHTPFPLFWSATFRSIGEVSDSQPLETHHSEQAQ
jgi:hypothetical protein